MLKKLVPCLIVIACTPACVSCPHPGSQHKLLSIQLHDAPHGRCGPLDTTVPPSCCLGLHADWTSAFRPFVPCSKNTSLISITAPLTCMVQSQRYSWSNHCPLESKICVLYLMTS